MNVGLKVGFLTFEREDIFKQFGGKRGVAGPSLIMEHQSGLAFETGQRAINHWQPWLDKPHGGTGQLWMLERLNDKASSDHMVVRSVINGLAFDRTWEQNDRAPLILYERHGLADEQWRLQPTPDRKAKYIVSATDDRVIDVGEDPEVGLHPWIWTKRKVMCNSSWPTRSGRLQMMRRELIGRLK